jgi:hypothetical protein
LVLLIAAVLLVSPLTARALTPRYDVSKGVGKYLAMLVRSRLAALPIPRSANSTISICFNHLVGEGTAEDRLDVVTICIEHKCSVVIRPVQTGRSVFDSACLEGGGVECIDLGSSFGCKGGMLFDGVWVISIDPEDRIIETVATPSVPALSGICITRRIPSAPKATS